jgi:MFS family permease
MTTFTAAGIIPAFELLASDLHVTLKAATYLTSSQIAMHGLAPIFWKPFSNVYGRRPVWLLSALGSLLFNIGCANSHTYGSQQVCRILTQIFISPAVGIGSAVVTESFFAHERASKMVPYLFSSSSMVTNVIGDLDTCNHLRASTRPIFDGVRCPIHWRLEVDILDLRHGNAIQQIQ